MENAGLRLLTKYLQPDYPPEGCLSQEGWLAPACLWSKRWD